MNYRHEAERRAFKGTEVFVCLLNGKAFVEASCASWIFESGRSGHECSLWPTVETLTVTGSKDSFMLTIK